jgi:hypothetical protein
MEKVIFLTKKIYQKLEKRFFCYNWGMGKKKL